MLCCLGTFFKDLNATTRTIIALTISPLVASWMWIQMIRLIPHQDHFIYVSLILCTDIALILWLRRYYKPSLTNIKEFDFSQYTKELLLCCLIIILSIVHYIYLPLMDNDPLEYFYMAKILLSTADSSWYPSVSADSSYGIVAPFTHPLGYISFIALNMVGIEDYIGANYEAILISSKIACLYYPLITAFTLAHVLNTANKQKAIIWAILLYFSIPLVMHYIVKCHVDPMRIALMLISSLLLYELLRSQYRDQNVILLGFLCGLAWFVHSSGILNAFIIFAIYSLFVWHKHGFKLGFITGIICIACLFLVVGIDLYKIYSVLGSVLGDTNNIEVIRNHINEYNVFWDVMRDSNGIFNLLRTFYEIKYWGIVYFLGVIGIFLNRKTLKECNILSVLFATFALFYLIALLATALGFGVFIFNPRYLMQPLYVMVIFGAIFLSDILFKRKYISIGLTSVFILVTIACITREFYTIKSYSKIELTEHAKLKNVNQPFAKIAEFINQNSKNLSSYVVLRQGEMLHYTTVPFYYVYDKRIAYLVDIKDINIFNKELEKLDIKYLLNTYYQDPLVTKSLFANVTGNTPLYENDLYALYHASDNAHLKHNNWRDVSYLLSQDRTHTFITETGAADTHDIEHVDSKRPSTSLYHFEIEADQPKKIVLSIYVMKNNGLLSTLPLSKKEYVLTAGNNEINTSFSSNISVDNLRLRAHYPNNGVKILKFTKAFSDYKNITNSSIRYPINYSEDKNNRLCFLSNSICTIQPFNGNQINIAIPNADPYKTIRIRILGNGLICKKNKSPILRFIDFGNTGRECKELSPYHEQNILYKPIDSEIFITPYSSTTPINITSVEYNE